MIAGVEQIFHLVYELAHWSLEWTVPKMEMIEATDEGVKITGKRVKKLGPGFHYYHQKLSSIYTTNVMRQTLALPDQLLTTQDGKRVRVGGMLVYRTVDSQKWLIDNEHSGEAIEEMAAHALREVIIQSDFMEMQKARSQKRDVLTKSAQEQLSMFGVRVEYLRLTSFAETDAKDLHHTGSLSGGVEIHDEEDE